MSVVFIWIFDIRSTYRLQWRSGYLHLVILESLDGYGPRPERLCILHGSGSVESPLRTLTFFLICKLCTFNEPQELVAILRHGDYLSNRRQQQCQRNVAW